MATYLYSDWASQSTASARLARARLHHAELSALVDTEVSGDGRSESSQAIVQRLKELEARIREMESSTARAGGVSQIRIGY